MQAIILAAGMGKRLKDLTRESTKCMVEVDGESMIKRLLRQLDSRNLKRIVIVTGYMGQKLVDYVGNLDVRTPIQFVDNPNYETTNNIHSLYLAADLMKEDDTLLFESDIILEDSIISRLIEDPRHSLAVVDKFEIWMDGTCVILEDDDSIADFVPKSKFDFTASANYYKTVNIYKFSKAFTENTYLPFLKAYIQAMGKSEYYEQVLRVITVLDEIELKAMRLSGEKWYEIDDAQDLDIASVMFSKSPSAKLKSIQARFGGYWRFPKILDFCYLVNPYFPPKKMIDEIKSNTEVLLRQYPSGMNVNSSLVAKIFNIPAEKIIVGNGAAELIKSVLESTEGKLGIICPTFEEYPNRYSDDDTIRYVSDKEGYRYSAKDLMDFFTDKPIGTLVLINPDNPSGNYIPRRDVLTLADWCRDRGIRLILDESFIDFSEESDGTLLTQDVLDAYPEMVLIKSISKSYGVPGARLGILASADTEMVRRLKASASLWNINSFGEFYLQVEEKYESDYRKALMLIKAERRRFYGLLCGIPHFRPVPSEANYILVGLDGISSTALTEDLLWKYDIFIKDLRAKTGEDYIRIAVRDSADNDRLIRALRELLSD